MADMIELYRQGQSIWLDFLARNLIDSGALQTLVRSGLRGVTTNPTIFHNAIGKTDDYDDSIRDLIQSDPSMEPETLYHWLTIQDVRMAADILRGVYDSSSRADGYVSLEVSPHLARDTAGTIDQARHLWREVDRPNLMIKVPATVEGLQAIEELITDGINVNVTLLFSIERYAQVFEAYTRGLERCAQPERIASVASFFVSRVDTRVDDELDGIGRPEAAALKGNIAVANAKLAYQRMKELAAGDRFTAQQRRGARVQRLLWASTGTKNPDYPDLLYVNNLIGPDTVNTLPPKTLDAFEHHGEIAPTLERDVDQARRRMATLADLGIDIKTITGELEAEGIAAFVNSYDLLIKDLASKRALVAADYAGA